MVPPQQKAVPPNTAQNNGPKPPESNGGPSFNNDQIRPNVEHQFQNPAR